MRGVLQFATGAALATALSASTAAAQAPFGTAPSAPSPAAAPAAPAPPTVVVLQQVNTNYADPSAIASAVANALPAAATVRPQEGYQKLISRLYSVGHSNAPAAYNLLESTIRSMNNLGSDSVLVAGQTLMVPDLPKIAKPSPSPTNPYNAIPKISIDTRKLAAATALIHPANDRRFEDVQHAGAQIVTLIRNLSREDRNVAVARKKTLLTIEEPLQLHFLAPGGPGPEYAGRALSAADIAALHVAGAAPRLQTPVLIIADQTWPSLAKAEASRGWVLSKLRDLRAANHIPPMTTFVAGCGLGQANSSWPPEGAVPTHTALIARSLEALLMAAGPNTGVKVVYIPVLALRPCAKEVIGQLIEFHLLMRHRAGNTNAPTPAGDVAQFHDDVRSILAALGTTSLADFGNSDAEVIQAILDFAQRVGDQPRTPVFTSMSWEFALHGYELAVPAVLDGLFVVSAGNEGLDDNDKPLPPVTTTKLQFADRSLQPGDMLSVMNVGPDGHFSCHSSVVDPAGGGFVTSFPGDLGPKCGTSFSAPRVAWLLALRESTRAPLADPSKLGAVINADLKARGLSGMSGTDPKALDIAALFR